MLVRGRLLNVQQVRRRELPHELHRGIRVVSVRVAVNARALGGHQERDDAFCERHEGQKDNANDEPEDIGPHVNQEATKLC